MNYQISFDPKPNTEDINILNNGIMEQARQKKNMKTVEYFAFFLRDANNKIVGGCAGDYMYGGVYIGSLWLTEALRHQGYGSQLMQKAEGFAKEKDASFISVNTFNWEALDFYKKLGFMVEFERKGYDHDSTFYFLRKNLK